MGKLEKIQKSEQKGKEAPIVKLMTDKDKEVKLAAIAAGGRVGKDDSFNVLITALTTDEDPDIRAAAATALAVMKNEHARAHMQYRLEKESDPKVISAIKAAIQAMSKVRE